MGRKVWFGGILLVISTVIVARDVLLAKGIEFYLSRTMDSLGIHVKSIERERNTIKITGLTSQNSSSEVSVEDLRISFHLSIVPFRLEPSIFSSNVLIALKEHQEEGHLQKWPIFLIKDSWIDIKLSIEQGLLQSSLGEFFSFSFFPGEKEKEIGTLFVQDRENKPFVSAFLGWEQGTLVSELEIIRGKVPDLIALSSFVQNSSIQGNGEVSLSLKGRFKPSLGLEQLEGTVGFQKVDVLDPSRGIDLHSEGLKGTFLFSRDGARSFWENTDLFLTFEDTSLLVIKKDTQIGFKEGLGEIRLHPNEDPYLKIGGGFCSQGLSIPFQIEGCGQLLEKGSYWIQTELEFFLPKSSPHLTFSVCQNETKESVVQLECADISQEILDVATCAFPLLGLDAIHLEGSQVEGKLIGTFAQGVSQKWEFFDCKLKDSLIAIPSKEMGLASENLAFTGLFTRQQNGRFEIDSLDAEVRKANLFLKNGEQVQSISAKVKIDQGSFLPSYLEGIYQGVFASAQVLEKTANNLLRIECKAPSKRSLEALFCSEKSCFSHKKDPVFLVLDVSSKDDKTYATGTLQLASSANAQENIAIEATLDKVISLQVETLSSNWDLSSLQGVFTTGQISLDSMAVPEISLQGSFKAEGSFDDKRIEVNVSELNCIVGHPIGQTALSEARMHLEYEYKTKNPSGSFFAKSLCIQHRDSLKIPIELGGNSFFFEGTHLWADACHAKVGDLQVLGSLIVDKAGIHLISQQFEGNLQSLIPLIEPYVLNIPRPLAHCKGTFRIAEGSCVFDLLKKDYGWNCLWKASLQCKELALDFEKFGRLKECEFSLKGNSEGDFGIYKIQGEYQSPSSTSCMFSLSDLSLGRNSKELAFSFIAKDSCREWAKLQGKLEKNQEGVMCVFAPDSSLLGLSFTLKPFYIDPSFSVSPIELSSNVKFEQIVSVLDRCKQMGLVENIENGSFLSSCKGGLQLQFLYDNKKNWVRSSLKSSDFSYQGRFLGDLEGTVVTSENTLKVDSLKVGSYCAKASFDIQPSEWKASMFSLESNEGKIALKGSYFPLTHKVNIPSFLALIKGTEIEELQMQGSFEGFYDSKLSSLLGKGSSRFMAAFPKSFQIGFESIKEVSFVVDSSKGVQMDKSDWSLIQIPSKNPLGKMSAKKISYQMLDQRFLVEGGYLHIGKEVKLPFLPKELNQLLQSKDIDLSMDIDLSPRFHKVSALLKNGVYPWQGKEFDLKQIQLLWEQNMLYASCQSMWQETPLWVQTQLELGKNPSLLALIKDAPDKNGIAMKFNRSSKEQWFCKTIQGDLKGIDIEAHCREGDLDKRVYDIALSMNLSEAGAVLPKEWRSSLKKWGMGNGYGFKGSLACKTEDPFHLLFFKGDIKGENFECLGRTFDMLQAKVDFTGDKGSIQSVKLEDSIGLVSIKMIDFQKQKNTGLWEVSSPLVHVRDFAPALFLKGRKERGVELKNLSFYEIKGTLAQPDSFEAKGALHFSCLEKKEFSFWDVPLGFMKDWGLDPGLLTPVMGEADFVLHQGRFYFTDLRNVYSEGKRSQFYLAGPSNDAYLGLDGSWHVDLAMQQNVVWKLTEDLIVSIRGTIEKPKYSFKANKER